MRMKPSQLVLGLGAVMVTAASAMAAGSVLWTLTAGLTRFTSESWRRAAVLDAPSPVPRVDLQDERGRLMRLDELCTGRVLVIDFVYTQCQTICKSLGVTSSQLARRLAASAGLDEVGVVSISFDPDRDTPDRLQAFKRAMEPAPTPWRLARPMDSDGRRRLLDAFGVVVIADGLGGYDHNAALHVVDQRCRLVQILDADGAADAEAAARSLVTSKGS